MKYAVVTGVSSGLGFAIAKLLLESGIHVYGVSRTDESTLMDVAKENNVDYVHYPCDLSEKSEVTKTLEKLSDVVNHWTENDQLFVVNNAAVIQPIKPAHTLTQEELAYHYEVNVLAPIQLMNTLLAKSMERNVTFVGLNVTSGAAVNPLFGWSAYCSAKASINMYTKTVAHEQNELQTENKMIAFNPGIMDTNMQAEIRSTDQANFRMVEQFKQYKQQGILSQTEAVASILIDIMTDEANIVNGTIYDVNDYT